MPLQGFIDNSPPVIGATWLNSVDVLLTTVFQGATTAALARTAIGLGTGDSPTFTGLSLSGLSGPRFALIDGITLSTAAEFQWNNQSSTKNIELSGSGSNKNYILTQNTHASGNAVNRISVSSGTGDAWQEYTINGGTNLWYTGIDNSSSDRYVLGYSGTGVPGSGDLLTVSTTGDLNLTGTATITKTSAGATTTPIALINSSTTASTAVILDLVPSTGGPGVRSAQLKAVNNGANAITLSCLISNGATPAQAWETGPTGVMGIGIVSSATSWLTVKESTSTVCSFRIPHGAAPSAPVNGDMWTTTAGLFVRINGSTVGPLS